MKFQREFSHHDQKNKTLLGLIANYTQLKHANKQVQNNLLKELTLLLFCYFIMDICTSVIR